jgi:hypothetical protein
MRSSARRLCHLGHPRSLALGCLHRLPVGHSEGGEQHRYRSPDLRLGLAARGRGLGQAGGCAESAGRITAGIRWSGRGNLSDHLFRLRGIWLSSCLFLAVHISVSGWAISSNVVDHPDVLVAFLASAGEACHKDEERKCGCFVASPDGPVTSIKIGSIDCLIEVVQIRVAKDFSKTIFSYRLVVIWKKRKH